MVGRCDHPHHHLEKFDDLYTPDAIWAARQIWQHRVKSIEMSAFQEAMVTRGLRNPDKAEKMPGCASIPMGYSAVMAGECFERIDELSEEIIHQDLLVWG